MWGYPGVYIQEVLLSERCVYCKRDVYIAVELTGRPTIRVVSHL